MILDFTEKFPIIGEYLPDNSAEVMKMPRDYIIDLVNSLVEEEFGEWIKEQNEMRKKIDMRNQLNEGYCIMKPEIAQLLIDSKDVASGIGISVFFLNPNAKKRRSKAEL